MNGIFSRNGARESLLPYKLHISPDFIDHLQNLVSTPSSISSLLISSKIPFCFWEMEI